MPLYPASTLNFYNVKDYGVKGNGTADDGAALNATIAAVIAAGGGIVYLPPGTYLHNAADILINGDNVVLQGAGPSSIIKNGTSNAINGIKVSGANHVIIRDLAVDGNRTNIVSPPAIGSQYAVLSNIWFTGCDDVRVENCVIHEHYAGGILADSTNNIYISDNRIYSGNDNGVFLRPSAGNVACTNATISGNIASGMAFSGLGAIRCSYVTFADNVCFSNGPTAAQGCGIGAEGCSYVTISNNVCYSNAIQGIQIRYTNEGGSTIGSSHVTCAGNVIYNHTSTNGDAGGILVNGDDIVLFGNLIYSNAFGVNLTDISGISCTNCFFGDNTVRNNSNVGIRIGSTAVTNMILDNNVVTGNASHGLYTITRVMVQGGIYAGNTGGGHNGIYLDTGSDGSIIDGAFVFDNADNGILVNAGANHEIRNCYFANIVGTNQGRAMYEAGGAGPTVMLNNRIKAMSNEPYHFDNASSRYYDYQTYGTVTITTATYTAIADDSIILCNRAGTITVTIPNPSKFQGRVITVKDVSGAANTNNITVAGAAGNIDGAANKVINTAYGVLRLTNDGTNWFTI
jgi:parallel beta-helix repeat protein